MSPTQRHLENHGPAQRQYNATELGGEMDILHCFEPT